MGHGPGGWIPDWFGNNGRTVIQALFQGPNCVVNTVNYGCYDNSTVNSLITSAEGASSTSAAGNYWHQADMQIMSDAAIVPIMNQGFPQYTSARVRGIASTADLPDSDLPAEHRRSGHHRRLAGQRLNSRPVIGHVATRWGLDHFIGGVRLEDLVDQEFAWQEGWEYRIN